MMELQSERLLAQEHDNRRPGTDRQHWQLASDVSGDLHFRGSNVTKSQSAGPIAG
jgi:hypothetical protein